MELFLHPSTWLFTAAIGLMLALSVLESIAWLCGLGGLSGWFDHGFDGHDWEMADGASIVGWLHLGKVPLTILLILFLSAFGVSGFIMQILARQYLGQYLPLALVAPAAVPIAVLVVRVLGGVFVRLIPKDQSFAVSLEELVGRIAIVSTGTARHGNPAQARVKDGYGTTHYVRVEPEAASDEFPSGSEVLLLRRVNGSLFKAILNPRPGLLSS